MTMAKPQDALMDLAPLAVSAPERLKQIDELLAEGATFEDVVATLNAEPGAQLTPLAVENYFCRNLELQARRVRRMVEKAETLRAALGSDPDSSEAKLAQATLFTGLMGLRQKATAIDLEDVHILRLRREKLDLECKIQRMRENESRERRRLDKAKTAYMIAKHDKVRFELHKMRDLLRTLKRGNRLDTETINRIREIYGIIQQPYIEDNPQEAPAQA